MNWVVFSKSVIRSSSFEAFLIFSGAGSRAKFFQGRKCTSQIWKCAVIGLSFYHSIQQTFVRLGAGTRDEPVRTSAWEATCLLAALSPLELRGTEDADVLTQY